MSEYKLLCDEKLLPHEITIASFSVPSGEDYTIVASESSDIIAFRSSEAERIEGIEYEAFDALRLFVGQNSQWHYPRPMVNLFTALRKASDKMWSPPGLGIEDAKIPLDTCSYRLPITLMIKNNHNKSLPFAIKFVGQKLVKR